MTPHKTLYAVTGTYHGSIVEAIITHIKKINCYL